MISQLIPRASFFFNHEQFYIARFFKILDATAFGRSSPKKRTVPNSNGYAWQENLICKCELFCVRTCSDFIFLFTFLEAVWQFVVHEVQCNVCLYIVLKTVDRFGMNYCSRVQGKHAHLLHSLDFERLQLSHSLLFCVNHNCQFCYHKILHCI